MNPTKEFTGRSIIRMYNADCMDLMSSGKTWDLAIVDPPYGIGAGGKSFINGTSKTVKKYYKSNDWDIEIPNKKYFKALHEVSYNQIIWGGNYFCDYLGAFRCFIGWDKTIHGNSYSDMELAWTSFDKPARYFRENISQTNSEGRIHPTQKSIKMYKWILSNYANEGDTILDTHGGSMSIAIACWDLGFDLDICELDTDYFNDAVKRFENHISQTQLF